MYNFTDALKQRNLEELEELQICLCIRLGNCIIVVLMLR